MLLLVFQQLIFVYEIRRYLKLYVVISCVYIFPFIQTYILILEAVILKRK
jgi:hypothetical protein